MPLDPQSRAILDTLESKGLLPLVRGDALKTRARYRQLALSRRAPQYVADPVASKRTIRRAAGWPTRPARGWSRRSRRIGPRVSGGLCGR